MVRKLLKALEIARYSSFHKICYKSGFDIFSHCAFSNKTSRKSNPDFSELFVENCLAFPLCNDSTTGTSELKLPNTNSRISTCQ